jgi:hypothetical protein
METAGRRSLRMVVPIVEVERGLSGSRLSTLPTGGRGPNVLR